MTVINVIIILYLTIHENSMVRRQIIVSATFQNVQEGETLKHRL